MSTTQKAVVFRSHGDAQKVLHLDAQHPRPSPASLGIDDVLIAVRAAALNPVDKIRVSGGLKALRPEAFKSGASVLGYDASGVITATGAGVSAWKPGDEVLVRVFSSQPGTVAEVIVANQHSLAHKPATLSFEEAASLPLAGVTALQLLKKGGVTKGSKVFISGGAGGVGTIALQLAKHVFGAELVATTASAGVGTDLCMRMGADVVVDYKTQDFQRELAGKDFDVAIDTTHESAQMASILKPAGGKVITIADTPTVEALKEIGARPGLLVRTFLNAKRNKVAEKAAQARNASWSYLFLNVNGQDLEELASYVKAGKVNAVVDEIYDLDRDWQAAIARAFSGRAKGKVVIRVSADANGANDDAGAVAAEEKQDAAAEDGEGQEQEHSQPAVDVQGVLTKQSKWLKSWKQRWLELHVPAGEKPYLLSMQTQKALGTGGAAGADAAGAGAAGRLPFELTNRWELDSHTTIQDNKTKANAFTVVTGSGQRINLAADSPTDQRRWVQALRHAIAA